MSEIACPVLYKHILQTISTKANNPMAFLENDALIRIVSALCRNKILVKYGDLFCNYPYLHMDLKKHFIIGKGLCKCCGNENVTIYEHHFDTNIIENICGNCTSRISTLPDLIVEIWLETYTKFVEQSNDKDLSNKKTYTKNVEQSNDKDLLYKKTILYFMSNYKLVEQDLVNEIAKQFDISIEQAQKEITQVKQILLYQKKSEIAKHFDISIEQAQEEITNFKKTLLYQNKCENISENTKEAVQNLLNI